MSPFMKPADSADDYRVRVEWIFHQRRKIDISNLVDGFAQEKARKRII